ncbi:MFS transporter [Rhodospirillum rubrum]|uniref:MFS transporter n=1 Tax=Rhodospirillum rubrum TaxID=1085 RepID=UPI001F5B9EC8|nr:MFS transporter [Rhodospirillum rubrum]
MDTTAKPCQGRKLLVMIGCLYLVQGLPVGLAFQAYPVLLRDGGASLELISLVPLASLPWVFKVLWASLVENHWSARLGRRRSWILPMQTALALSLAGMAFLPFTAGNAPALLALVALASLVSATQDIATDGLASERLHGTGLAHVNTVQVAGFMIGMLAGGPLAMVGIGALGHLPTLLGLAVMVLLCGLPVALWREPDPPQGKAPEPASLRAFFRRPGALPLLALGMCATMGGAVSFGVAKLFLIDAGWSLDAVGTLSGTGNTLMIVAGCAIAGGAVVRFGALSTLVLGGGLVGISSLLWAVLAMDPSLASLGAVWGLATASGLGIGVCTVASYTLLMGFAQRGQQPGTDYSAFQGLQTLGEIVVMAATTALAARAGYAAALVVGLILALALLAMVARLRKAALVNPALPRQDRAGDSGPVSGYQ